MITRFDDTYYLYYTANPGGVGAIYARTSTDLRSWSESTIVSSGGSAGSDWLDAEVPVVLFLAAAPAFDLVGPPSRPGAQRMGTSVYRTTDPLDFGVDNDRYLVTTLPSEATWIVNEGDDYYIAAVMPGLQGYRVSRLKWVYK